LQQNIVYESLNDYSHDHGHVVTQEHIVPHKTVKASEFKAKCLQFMEEIKQTGEEIIITKNGEPVSKLVPIRHKPKSLFGAHKGKIVVTGDIVAPLNTGRDCLQ
jgi:prevent-host-death family protein